MSDIVTSEPEPGQAVSASAEASDGAVTRLLPAKRGWFGPLFGGAIAAAIGFGMAQFVPNGWPLQDTAALQTNLATQKGEIDDLKAQLTALAEQPTPEVVVDTSLQARVAALEAQAPADITPLQQRVADLEQKFVAIEAMPAKGDAPSAAALAAQKVAADSALKQAEETAAKIKSDAEAIAKASIARAALGRVQAALDSGAAYAAALRDLDNVPTVLSDNAETGLPTLAALQQGFPAAARTALEIALRENMGATWAERATSFFRTQTGARSLTPREGSDPDAILSRAEAALGSGDIKKALAEIAALPPQAKAAMADWQKMAQTRQAGTDAVAALAAAME